MREDERASPQALSIAEVERETGLSKDTLRVWERRYGFPKPLRDRAGDRAYPPEQVQRLRTLRRLLDAGHRPGRIVALEHAALHALAEPEPGAPTHRRDTADDSALETCIDLITTHDVQGLRRELTQASLRLGLVDFVTLLMAPLNIAVGDAWADGRLQVFEEHLYTECVTGVLRNAMASVPVPQGTGAPRVLLTTVPQEPHRMGLLMVEALLALEGCHCLALGAETPIGDIVQAARAHRADIVALSFTATLSAKVVVAALRQLRRQLPPAVAIWAGGECPVLYQRGVPGVLPVRALESLREQVAHWRTAAGSA